MTLYQAVNNILNNENIIASVKSIQEEEISIDLTLLKESVENFQFYENLALKTKALEVLFTLIKLIHKDGSSVDRLILEGHKIPAIKEYRNRTGASLIESKIYVERRIECLSNLK